MAALQPGVGRRTHRTCRAWSFAVGMRAVMSAALSQLQVKGAPAGMPTGASRQAWTAVRHAEKNDIPIARPQLSLAVIETRATAPRAHLGGSCERVCQFRSAGSAI
eukprot:6207081-Pleurochrysis_carterae.AAC.1